MRPRPPFCCRAVHRRIYTNSDVIWITDDVLSHAYLNFCANSRSQRRHGSHVPGPMEAKRRMGRRKLALMAEIEPPSRTAPFLPVDFLSRLKKSFRTGLGEKREAPWDLKWEPPRASVPAADRKVEPARTQPALETALPSKQRSLLHELEEFRVLLSTTRHYTDLCKTFNAKVQETLELGLMSDDELHSYVRKVTRYLNQKIPNNKRKASTYHVKFLTAVWKGISACEKKGVRDLEPRVLSRILFSIARMELSHCHDSELLVTGILGGASQSQLPHLVGCTALIVQKWAYRWAYSWIHGRSASSIRRRKVSIHSSVAALAKALNLIDQGNALGLVTDLTIQLGMHKSLDSSSRRLVFRNVWLKLVSQVNCIDEAMFNRISHAVDQAYKEAMNGTAYSDISTNSIFQRPYGSQVPGPTKAEKQVPLTAKMERPSRTVPGLDLLTLLKKGLLGLGDQRKAQQDLTPRLSTPGADQKIDVEIQPVHETGLTPKQKSMMDELDEFRDLLPTTFEYPKLCRAFNAKVRDNLELGLMSDDELQCYLTNVPKYLNQKISDERHASVYIVRFFTAVWEGVDSRKDESVRDLKSGTLGDILSSIASLEIVHCRDAELLFTGVLGAAQESQLPCLAECITLIVKRWAYSWAYGWIHESTATSIRREKASIDSSVVALAKAFNLIDQESVLEIVRDLTARLGMHKSLNNLTKRVAFRNLWLKLVSHVKCIDEPMLIRVWQVVDRALKEGMKGIRVLSRRPQIRELQTSECSDILLAHWTNCNLVKDQATLLRTLKTLRRGRNRSPRKKLSCLIAALDKNRELHWNKVQSLMRIFRDVGLHSQTLRALKYLPYLGVKLPAHVIAPSIKDLSRLNFKVALSIYKLYPRIRWDRKCLTTKLDAPDSHFYIRLIRSRMPPADIWRLLRIPRLASIWGHQACARGAPRGRKALHASRVALMRRMAVEFAASEHLSARQAERNVMQCAGYLRRHHVPLAREPVLTRALVHACVARKVARGRWVGGSKLRWLLRCVAAAEGADVALELEAVVRGWRDARGAAERWERRDGNPLRAGPDGWEGGWGVRSSR